MIVTVSEPEHEPEPECTVGLGPPWLVDVLMNREDTKGAKEPPRVLIGNQPEFEDLVQVIAVIPSINLEVSSIKYQNAPPSIVATPNSADGIAG